MQKSIKSIKAFSGRGLGEGRLCYPPPMPTETTDWRHQTARDILALGSPVFYAIVIARALIGPYEPYLNQLLIAAVLLFAFSLFLKKFDGYVARGLILGVFTSLLYEDVPFAIFTALLYATFIASSAYLKTSLRQILQGICLGAVSTGAGYYLASLM